MLDYGRKDRLSRQRRRLLLLALATGALPWLTSCGAPPPPAGPRYGDAPAGETTVLRFAVHPLHNPQKMSQAYQPLIDYLNRHLDGTRLELEPSRDYADFEGKFRRREPAFLLPNPWQTLEARKAGYQIIAMAGEPADFKGLFIVRRDSGIARVADLKGKAVSYPSPTALAACLMPQWLLHNQGIDVRHDIENRYVGSQESSIMNVYLGQTAAGATWSSPWRAFQKDHPDKAAQLRVAWETAPLVNNSVMVRDDVPAAVREAIRDHLLRLESAQEGPGILADMATARFLPADDRDYQPVQRFIDQFEQQVRPVEERR